MKKKTMAMIAAGALVIGMVPAALFASGQGVGRQIVDLDDNGVCDNHGKNCKGFIDENNDGVCDHRPANGNNQGNGYVDANNDGVCDNYSAQGGRHGHHGMGHVHGQGRGCA